MSVKKVVEIIKKQILYLTSIIFLLFIGFTSLSYLADKEAAEVQLTEWEKTVACQLKRSFSDIEEIHFKNQVNHKYKTVNATNMSVEIKTKGSNLMINLSLLLDKTRLTLPSNSQQLVHGRTTKKILVIYSNGKKEKL